MTVEDGVAQEVRTLRPRATHRSCTHARQEVESALEDARVVQQDVAMIALALGELLSNAVRHGQPFTDGTIEVSWALREDAVWVAVLDGGQAPHLEARLPAADSATGRGLWMVAHVCQDWGVELRDGTQVWAEFSATRRV